jgi:hypothetical protein
LFIYFVGISIILSFFFTHFRITYPLDAILHLTVPKYALYAQIIASFLVPLQGFLNGLVYGVTLYSKQFKLCRKEVNEAEEIESTQFNQTIAPA